MYIRMIEILSIETTVHPSKETKSYIRSGKEYVYGNISIKSSNLTLYIGKKVTVKVFMEKDR